MTKRSLARTLAAAVLLTWYAMLSLGIDPGATDINHMPQQPSDDVSRRAKKRPREDKHSCSSKFRDLGHATSLLPYTLAEITSGTIAGGKGVGSGCGWYVRTRITNGGKGTKSNLTITGTAEETFDATRVALSTFVIHSKMLCQILGHPWDGLRKMIRLRGVQYHLDMGLQRLKKEGGSVGYLSACLFQDGV